jgi:hypothetical protein
MSSEDQMVLGFRGLNHEQQHKELRLMASSTRAYLARYTPEYDALPLLGRQRFQGLNARRRRELESQCTAL